LEWRGGDRAPNLEAAIGHQRAVLDDLTRERDERLWALVHHNLGNVYAERTLGDRAQNIEDAIEDFNAALTVFTRESWPEEWAMVNKISAGSETILMPAEGRTLTSGVLVKEETER
jgi:hypothetical protein